MTEYKIKQSTLSKMLDICLKRGAWFNDEEWKELKQLKDDQDGKHDNGQ